MSGCTRGAFFSVGCAAVISVSSLLEFLNINLITNNKICVGKNKGGCLVDTGRSFVLVLIDLLSFLAC